MENRPVTINPMPDEPPISSYLHNRAGRSSFRLNKRGEMTSSEDFPLTELYDVRGTAENAEKGIIGAVTDI